MRWRGQRQSSNIEDRRGVGAGGYRWTGGRMPIGFPTGRTSGGIGLGGLGILAAILLIGWMAGVNPIDMLGGTSTSPSSVDQTAGEVGTPTDEEAQFVAAVLGSTEDVWTQIFSERGERYELPTLVLFAGQVSSACGFATAAAGPFYCPNDQKVYIDLAFYRQLRDQFNAPGDFAQAYVIAHEIGHHVQTLLGSLSPGSAGANSDSVRTELQADCYAGIWANRAEDAALLEVGDIDEALNAAAQIGDDTLQRQSQGYVVPDSFTHGSAAQRSRWFKRGYEIGEVAACDTFAATQL